MILVFIGAPGAGKGTQADLLVKNKGYRKLSTGDALRKHIKQKTEIGKKISSVMESGNLVSDEILSEVLAEELDGCVDEVVILDGYPRNIEQAKALDRINDKNPIKGVIHIDVPTPVLIERLSGRRVCSSCGASFHVTAMPSSAGEVCDKCGGELIQRPDDRPENIAVRLRVYDELTKPVLDYYKKKGLYFSVNGDGDTLSVYRRLDKVVSDLI